MPKALVIFGAGGHAREVLEIAEALRVAGNEFEIIGFLVDAEFSGGTRSLYSYPVRTAIEDLVGDKQNVALGVGIGMPPTAGAWHQRLPGVVRPRLQWTTERLL